MDYSDKMRRCQDYVNALEEERRKIQVFHRELPLCLDLVTQAIDDYKQQLNGSENYTGRSECSEQTSSEGPVLEEFIPLKRSSSSSEDEEQSHSSKSMDKNEKMGKKSDWLSSVQLWNHDIDPTIKQDSPRKNTSSVIETKRNNGAFLPFQSEKEVKPSSSVSPKPSSTQKITDSSEITVNGGNNGKKEEKESQAHRKSRRCWSPELHRRFLHALQQLGGSHAATPKQIRELMKVDGLTNDEVKSHLQKYRLHTRRPAPGIHNNGSNHQQPQFIVVGGVWVPPPEYSKVAGSSTGEAKGITSNGIYTPVATSVLPQVPPVSAPCSPEKQRQQSPAGDDDIHSNSPASSSSTHTITAAY